MIQQMKFSRAIFLSSGTSSALRAPSNIPVGPGRGSAAGSRWSAYAMQITDIDPLQYGLLFERFLNPERVSVCPISISISA